MSRFSRAASSPGRKPVSAAKTASGPRSGPSSVAIFVNLLSRERLNLSPPRHAALTGPRKRDRVLLQELPCHSAAEHLRQSAENLGAKALGEARLPSGQLENGDAVQASVTESGQGTAQALAQGSDRARIDFSRMNREIALHELGQRRNAFCTQTEPRLDFSAEVRERGCPAAEP
jgi:hypothetical protein